MVLSYSSLKWIIIRLTLLSNQDRYFFPQGWWTTLSFRFRFGGILGSAPGAEFPVVLSNHVGFKPRLPCSSTHHSPESFTHLKSGWAQCAWLQWSYENWYFHLEISRSHEGVSWDSLLYHISMNTWHDFFGQFWMSVVKANMWLCFFSIFL